MSVQHLIEDKLSVRSTGKSGDVVLKIRNGPHWQVLRSPYRMRIFEAIRSANGCSIKELADALGGSTTALYYHLDLLTRAGMIASTVVEPEGGAASRGGRRPAVFVACGDRVVVEYDPSNGRDRRRVTAISRTWLDESQSELLPQSASAEAADPLDAQPVMTTNAWEILSESEADEIRAHLEDVEAVLKRARARRDDAHGVVRRANYHVAFTLVAAREQVLPSPQISTRAMAVLESGTPAA